EAATGDLRSSPLVRDGAALCVVLASAGYPLSPRTGDPISGVERAGTVNGVSVFHAGTTRRDGALCTAGGRVLAVTGLGADLAEAHSRAYAAVGEIDFEGKQYRGDIARPALEG